MTNPVDDSVNGFVEPGEASSLPPPRSVIVRVYKGQKILVLVLETGFEYDGAIYKTLSAVAKKITGQHCNRYHRRAPVPTLRQPMTSIAPGAPNSCQVHDGRNCFPLRPLAFAVRLRSPRSYQDRPQWVFRQGFKLAKDRPK